MGQAIETPDPPAYDLKYTKAAKELRNGSTKIRFCIDTSGATTDHAVVEWFPDDPRVTKICMKTVQKWRFTPFLEDGKPVKVCTVYDFQIHFQ